MDWKQIRDHYAAVLAASGLTQEVIATRGGLKRQNLVSKLLKNGRYGPSVQTFVRTIEGTGMRVSEFFAQIEQGATFDAGHGPANVSVSRADDARTHALLEAGRHLERAMQCLNKADRHQGSRSQGPRRDRKRRG